MLIFKPSFTNKILVIVVIVNSYIKLSRVIDIRAYSITIHTNKVSNI